MTAPRTSTAPSARHAGTLAGVALSWLVPD